ncbi:Hypothetical protein SRAE_1000040400 [Strongyloides ratti]|uniref:Secreted protein n=1 Tax=Strongyloides ratti TaxID=34506 RepID=A0A090KXA6_STRRB|nr:Hypothetical protein SRAE_1000040400 [Strongyloides ratti]CEF62130.1 Hypothetical protein SRAE_1000040400 [Strongyloides ratti]
MKKNSILTVVVISVICFFIQHIQAIDSEGTTNYVVETTNPTIENIHTTISHVTQNTPDHHYVDVFPTDDSFVPTPDSDISKDSTLLNKH